MKVLISSAIALLLIPLVVGCSTPATKSQPELPSKSEQCSQLKAAIDNKDFKQNQDDNYSIGYASQKSRTIASLQISDSSLKSVQAALVKNQDNWVKYYVASAKHRIDGIPTDSNLPRDEYYKALERRDLETKLLTEQLKTIFAESDTVKAELNRICTTG